MAEPSIVVEKHSEYIAKQCPQCKFGIEEGQVIVLCPVCKSPHHENCWYDSGGCGKLGCRGVASERPRDVQSVLAQSQRQRGAGGGTGGEEQQVDAKRTITNTIITILAIAAIGWLLWYAIR